MASFDAAGSRLASVPVTVTRPSFLLDTLPAPAENLVDGQEMSVSVSADTTEPLLVAQYTASVERLRGPGGRPVPRPPGGDGAARHARSLGVTTIGYTVAKTFVGEDGTAVDCSTFLSCVMAVDTVADDDVSLDTSAIEFVHPPPVVTASGTRGRLDGQPVTIGITGLKPGAGYILARCDRPADSLGVLISHCAPPTPESPILVHPDAAGNVDLTVPAAQRYTPRGRAQPGLLPGPVPHRAVLRPRFDRGRLHDGPRAPVRVALQHAWARARPSR